MKCLWIKLLSLGLATVTVCLAAACGGASESGARQIPSAADRLDAPQLPLESPAPPASPAAPPSPQDALRNLSSWPGTAPMVDVREVSEGLHFSNVEATGKGLSFGKAVDGMASAVFVMAPGSKSLEPLIALDWTADENEGLPTDSIHVGLADFVRDRWRWFPVELDEEHEDVVNAIPDALGSYVNADGLLLVAVVTTRTIPRNLETIKVGGNVLPSIEVEIVSDYNNQAELRYVVFDVDSDLVTVELDTDADGEMDFEIDPPARGERLSGEVRVNLPEPGIHMFSGHAEDADGSHWHDEWEFIRPDQASSLQDPQPVLVVPDNNIVQCGEPFICDASQSSDPDGEIISYRWKVKGRLAHEATTNDVASWETVLTECGVYRVELTVIDNAFRSRTTEAIIEVVDDERLWHLDSVDTGASVSRLAMIGSMPALATLDSTGIRYLKGYDAQGQNWSEPRSLYSMFPSYARPEQLRIIESNGLPLILYTRRTNASDPNDLALFAVQAKNVHGTSWLEAHKLIDFKAYRHDLALQTVNNKPAVLLGLSYGDVSELIYIQAMDIAAAEWSPAQELLNTNEFEIERVDLTWDGLRPLALFNALFNSSDLRNQVNYVLAAADADGTAWLPATRLSLPSGDSTERPQFFSFKGKPAIVSGDHDYLGNNRILIFAPVDPDYSEWMVCSEITPVQLDLVEYLEVIDATVIHGRPGILYVGESGTGELYQSGLFYVEALDDSGSKWAAPRLLHDNVLAGMHVPPRASLIESWDIPLVSFCISGGGLQIGGLY